MFLTGMGERESIACALSETVYFGDLRPNGCKPYSKITKDGTSFYTVPFASKPNNFLGVIRVITPKKIEVEYSENKKITKIVFRNIGDVKGFFAADLIY